MPKETMNDGAMPQWMLEENAARVGHYRKDASDEAFLFRLNADLAPLESSAFTAGAETRPIILFFGLPRCGKTFFSQMVSDHLDVGFPNNLSARFWRAPVVGLRLSRMLKVEQGSSFASDFGKTGGLGDIHDFHYFWHHWLKLDDLSEDARSRAARIDWQGLAAQLAHLSAYWARPGIMKAIDATLFMAEIRAVYPKVLFVFLERDPIDSAMSLLVAREKNFGTRDHWYGQMPPKDVVAALDGQPWHAQIAGQFRALLDLYEENLTRLPAENYLRLRYDAFCANPEAELERLRAACAVLGEAPAWRKRVDQEVVVPSSGKGKPEDIALMNSSLSAQRIPARLPKT
jgi:hypothetical protein